VAAIIPRLKAFRTDVWTQNFAGLGIPINIFFSLDHINRIARDGSIINTCSDLNTVLGTKYFLDSSFLQPYTQIIIKIITDTRYAVQHDRLPTVQSTQQQAGGSQGPLPRKRRKYDVEHIPENQLDPNNPLHQRILHDQRELQEYDRKLDEDRATRWKASQQGKAAHTVFERTQKIDTRKQKSITQGTTRKTRKGEHS
jgi:hypothetical protein